MSNLLTAALNYAALGYQVFPCKPGTKVPACQHGVKDAASDEEQIEAWWTATPDANIGLSTAGLLVVDIDGAKNPWLTGDIDKLMDLAAAPLSLTPSGGKHFLFRAEWGRNTASKLAEKVDTRGAGGYIVAPPSVLADGRQYRWSDGETPPVASLPMPPFWLTVALTANTSQAPERDSQPAVTLAIPEGRRNATLASLGGALRRIGLSADAILGALRAKNASDCKPPLPDDEIKIIAESTARYAIEYAATPEAQTDGAEIAAGLLAGPVITPQANLARDPGPLPSSILMPPGIISEVMDFTLTTAQKQQPELALAAALSLLATITGRKITDEHGTRTNLYCLGVAPTGSGKDRPRVVNKDLLFAAGLGDMIGPESIGSSAGLVTAVENQPAILFQIDEIGRILETLGDAKQAHLYGIVTVLMKLFTSSSTIYVGDAYADIKKIKKIYQPHACVYGTTVQDSLYRGLTVESLTNGMISRLLVFEGRSAAISDQKMLPLPPELVEQVRWWGDFKPGGNLSGQNPQPIVVPYTGEAEQVFSELLAEQGKHEMEKDVVKAGVWTRVAEKARKLALLYACSVCQDRPEVDGAAATWAAGLSTHLTKRILWIAREWISEGPFDRDCKYVLRAIRAGGVEGIRIEDLTHRTRRLKAKDRHEIIQALISYGDVVRQTVNTINSRPATILTASEFLTNL